MPGGKKITLEQAAGVVEAVEGRGWSQIQAGKALAVSQPTVSEILNGHRHWGEIARGPVFNALRMEQKTHFQAATLAVCKKALEQVDVTIGKASAYQAAGIYGLLRDHERKDAGEPTEIHANLTITAAVSIDKLADLLGRKLVDGGTFGGTK